MQQLRELVHVQTMSGDPVTVGDVTVTPQSRSLTIRCPFGNMVWSRPVAVWVERGAWAERIPIVDITRIVQLALLGFGLVFSVIVLVKLAQRKEA
jgi:hypothetical protein